MSITAYQNASANRGTSGPDAIGSWREDHSQLLNGLFLKHQRRRVDCGDLDRSVSTMQDLLDRQAGLFHRLGVLRELIEAFRTVIEHAEEKKADTYTLRKKLRSLEYRARSVLSEMEGHTRAPEFDERALRGILSDYRSIRN
jgi:hypothetical protein